MNLCCCRLSLFNLRGQLQIFAISFIFLYVAYALVCNLFKVTNKVARTRQYQKFQISVMGELAGLLDSEGDASERETRESKPGNSGTAGGRFREGPGYVFGPLPMLEEGEVIDSREGKHLPMDERGCFQLSFCFDGPDGINLGKQLEMGAYAVVLVSVGGSDGGALRREMIRKGQATTKFPLDFMKQCSVEVIRITHQFPLEKGRVIRASVGEYVVMAVVCEDLAALHRGPIIKKRKLEQNARNESGWLSARNKELENKFSKLVGLLISQTEIMEKDGLKWLMAMGSMLEGRLCGGKGSLELTPAQAWRPDKDPVTQFSCTSSGRKVKKIGGPMASDVIGGTLEATRTGVFAMTWVWRTCRRQAPLSWMQSRQRA